MKFAFFGTPDIAVLALEELESFSHLPALIVTNPDAPVGRKQILTPPPVKVWAERHNIKTIQPTSLKNPDDLKALTDADWDFFVVFAYGKIMPKWLIDLPKYGTINAHPSLLPKFRGASPIRSTLLCDLSASGMTIMQMDEELDHGPILFQQKVDLPYPIPGLELDTIMGRIGGDLLVHVMTEVTKSAITPTPQNHSEATYCTKITKDMAELKINPFELPTGQEALAMYHKICAFDGWPGTFFFHEGKRIKVTKASYDEDEMKLKLEKVIPEGKKEMDFDVYLGR